MVNRGHIVSHNFNMEIAGSLLVWSDLEHSEKTWPPLACRSIKHLIHRLRFINQPLRHILQPCILDRFHLAHIPPHTERMIMYEPPPTHWLRTRISWYVVGEIGIPRIICVRLVFHEARIEPKRAAIRVGLQWLRAADFGNAFVVDGDGAYDAGIARVESIGDIGEFGCKPECLFIA